MIDKLPGWIWPNAFEWAVLVAVGLLSVAAQVIFTFALRHVPAAAYGVISQLTPVITFALGMLLFDDALTMPILFGAGLTLVGVGWTIALEQRAAAQLSASAVTPAADPSRT